MTCFHPLKAFIVGIKPDGKKQLKIAPYGSKYVLKHGDSWIPHDCKDEYVNSPDYTVLKVEKKLIDDYVTIPCGKCIGCRTDHAKQWADRMMLELKYHEEACFITLTYSDEYVPLSAYYDDDGVEQVSLTLRKSDFQKFMKRLRKAFEPVKIRFYACGEYGTETKRPHYHAIMFGMNFKDRRPWKTSPDGFMQFRSETLEKIWPYGYSMVCDVSWDTCAYVARYVQKKHIGLDAGFYEYYNIAPEFSLMSRRPGIGRQYYDDNKDKIYENQEIFISTVKGGKKIRPPAYFDRLYDIDNHCEMELIKQLRREKSDNVSSVLLGNTDMTYEELLAVKEREFKSKMSIFRRDRC